MLYTGDPRLNQHFGITMYTVMFTRFHNYLVDRFRQLNPEWTGETLYQEARRFIAAANQIMIYRDYLPILLGTICFSNVRLFIEIYFILFFSITFYNIFAEISYLSYKIFCGSSKSIGFEIMRFQFFYIISRFRVFIKICCPRVLCSFIIDHKSRLVSN